MLRKLAALLAVVVATALVGWGAGVAHAAPAKIFIGGGSGILVLKGGNAASACTLTAIGKAERGGDLIGITAGHCGVPGQKVLSETFENRGQAGTITHINEEMDVAVIKFDAAKVVPLQTVRGVTIRSIDPRPIAFPTIACKEGRTTGNTCGVTWFSDGNAHFTQMCVVEGDSGSPVVVGDRLIGMVNAYYFFACIGPETGTNIGPILRWVNSTPYGGFRLV